MKTSWFPPHVLLLAVLAGAPAAFGQATDLKNPDRMVANLAQAVGLTTEQKAQAERIIYAAVAELLARPEGDRLKDPDGIRPRMRTEIRAILTPAQQKKYDRTPQLNGGGLTLQTPANKAGRLDALLKLSSGQMTQAIAIFSDELDALLDLPDASRPKDGAPIRQATRAKIRTILTPAQQEIYDVAPQGLGGASTKPGGG